MTKKNENLPAVPTKSFELATTAALPDMSVSSELAAKFTPEDFEGHAETFDSLPYVSIRQKEVIDKEAGTVLFRPGNFRISDSIFDATPDIDGREGLTIFSLIDTPCRVFFENVGDKKPRCKSKDAAFGIGDPGGVCRECKLNRFHPDNEGKDLRNVKLCKEGRLILAYDPNLKGCYLLQVGPSGIKPYDNYKKSSKKLFDDVPFMLHQGLVTTVYEEEPSGHYRPEFKPVCAGNDELYEALKQFRAEARGLFGAIVDKATDANPEHETLDTEAEVVEGEGVVTDEDGLPF